MKGKFWGTRGSLPSPGPETVRYGGNTSCVEVRASPGAVIVLDAGTGIRALGEALEPGIARVDVLLGHLHMDHIQGLGFFAALFRPALEVHIWGPATTTAGLRGGLTRYLSPPLFPVGLDDLPCALELHDVPAGTFELPGARVTAAPVCHRGPTLGYRIEDGSGSLAYLSDHEPALETSGVDLAAGVDVLIHDAQYTASEYEERIGWGHSSIVDATTFAATAGVRRLIGFHHDPAHDDDALDRMFEQARAAGDGTCEVTPAREGERFETGAGGRHP